MIILQKSGKVKTKEKTELFLQFVIFPETKFDDTLPIARHEGSKSMTFVILKSSDVKISIFVVVNSRSVFFASSELTLEKYKKESR
jgi:hypothetical protein